MQLQGLPAGNRTCVLWITRPVLYHWATEAVADNLGARSVYIYILMRWYCNAGEVQKYINYNNIWHLHSLSIDECHVYAFLGNSSVIKIYIIRPKTGPVAKNATPRPSGWESNPRPLDYKTSALPLSYRSCCQQLGHEFSRYIYIFWVL